MVGAPKDFHWLFHLTVPLAAPHVSLLIHILILYLSPKQIPGGTHPVSFHVLPYFGIHYLYPASLPHITCLNLNATSIVIFLLFDFFFCFPPFPLFSPHLEWPVKALWLARMYLSQWSLGVFYSAGTHINSKIRQMQSTITAQSINSDLTTCCPQQWE